MITRIFMGIGSALLVVGAWLGFSNTPHTSNTSPAPVEHQMQTETPTVEATTTTTVAVTNTSTTTNMFSLDSIPLGDGKVSTSPKTGYVYSCVTQFNGGGAEHAGNWIHSDTWSLNEKTSVEGSVSWAQAAFSNLIQGMKRLITGNGLPVGSNTGVFPIQRNDPAWQYDKNPNSIETQNVNYSLPTNPQFASAPSCVPMGAIGVALNGVAIYNALDAAGRDAVAHEVQDSCDGHPQGEGEYHYHGPSTCMPNIDKKDTVVGYALDGFAITSPRDTQGAYYTNADLDVCHGMTGTYTDEHGASVSAYHYVLTWEYPYTIGCFKGTPVKSSSVGGGEAQGGTHQNTNGQSGGTPPQGAIDACSSKTTGSSCSFSTPQGSVSGTCRIPPNSSQLACVPVQ